DGGVIPDLQRADKSRRRHANDGEKLPVEFERPAYDSRIRGEPLLPKLMAEYNDWRCARLIIFYSDRASQDRLRSQPGVITAGYGLPVDDLRLITWRRSHFADRGESKEIAERAVRCLRLRAQFFEDVGPKQRIPGRARRPRYERCAARAISSERAPGLPFKQRQRIRLVDRQGLEQHGIHYAENRRVRADAESQRDDRDQRETGMLHQHPRAVAQVLQKRLHETSSFNVASQVLDAPHISESPPRLSLRFIRSHPALDVLPRPHQQVKAHLIIHLLLDPVLAQQSVEPCIDQPQPVHSVTVLSISLHDFEDRAGEPLPIFFLNLELFAAGASQLVELGAE